MGDVGMTKVTIVEVGPRDGLQNEAARIATADKVGFVERLAAAGLPVVEVSSFVRPDRVPQLADAREVFAAHRPSARHALHRAGPQPDRPARGAGRRPRRGRDLRGGVRGLQPAQHQPLDRAVARRLRRSVPRRAATPASACAATCPRRSAVRSKARSSQRRVAALARQLARSRRLRSGGQRHDRDRASRAGAAGRRVASPAVRAARRRSRCTSTTRAGRRWPT